MTLDSIRKIEQQEIIKTIDYFENKPLTEEKEKKILIDALYRIFENELDIIDPKLKFNASDPLSMKNDVLLSIIDLDDLGAEILPEKEGKTRIGNFYSNTPYSKSMIELCLKHTFDMLSSNNKKDRVYWCKRVFLTLFHELKHYKQEMSMMQCESKKDTLLNAKDIVIKNYLPEFYKENYYVIALENNATAFAARTYQEIMGEDPYIKTLECIHRCEEDTGIYKINKRLKKQDNEDEFENVEITGVREIISPLISDIIIKSKNNPNIFEHLPILLKEYNMDFTRKSIPELIDNMYGEIKFIEGLYISQDKKEERISNVKQMYCQILLDSLSLTPPEEMEQIVSQLGQQKFSNILDIMQLNCELDKNAKLLEIRALRNVKDEHNNSYEEIYNNSNRPNMDLKEREKSIIEDYDALNMLFSKLQSYYCPDISKLGRYTYFDDNEER